MKKTVTIHQPDFLPWLGFFHRWQRSDLFILLDDVQFLRRGWHHRDKVKTFDGVVWLTVPVLKKGRYHQSINEVEIDDSRNWRQEHLNMLRSAYGKAPGFNYCFERIKAVYDKQYLLLMDLNLALLEMAAAELHIDTPTVMASQYRIEATRSERLIQLVKAVSGTHYLTGTGSRDYLDEEAFNRNGITVEWQEYHETPYPQINGAFVPGLSVTDYLMNREKWTDQ